MIFLYGIPFDAHDLTFLWIMIQPDIENMGPENSASCILLSFLFFVGGWLLSSLEKSWPVNPCTDFSETRCFCWRRRSFSISRSLAKAVGCQVKFEAHPIQSTLKRTNMSPSKFWVVVSSLVYFHPENWGRFPFQIGWENKYPFPVRREFLGFSTSFLEGNPQTVLVSWPWGSTLESSMVFPRKLQMSFAKVCAWKSNSSC